jgi:hypothetical protein
MRESRTYGSGRGACHEMHVPTATKARIHHAARGRFGCVAAGGAGAAAVCAGDWVHEQSVARRFGVRSRSVPQWAVLLLVRVEVHRHVLLLREAVEHALERELAANA